MLYSDCCIEVNYTCLIGYDINKLKARRDKIDTSHTEVHYIHVYCNILLVSLWIEIFVLRHVIYECDIVTT